MSEFGISSAAVLDRIRRSTPAGVRRFLRNQKLVASLWHGTMNRLRQGDVPPLAHPEYAGLVPELAKLGDDPKVVAGILQKWEASGARLNKYDALTRLVAEHPVRHRANLALALYEMEQRIDEVRSFPWQINMDLDSVCNVQCNFCKYEHNHVPKSFLPLDHIKSIEWFPFITTFNFSAGTAESIIHPRFNEIFDYVRDTYPHLFLHILTNGRGLTPDKLERFRDRLDWLYVSMNASNREDYDRAIHKGDWDKFSSNMKHMKRMLAGAKRPYVQANFVLMQWNVDRAVEYIEFAAEHGARRVSFSHFYTPYITDLHRDNSAALTRKFKSQDSLYFAKDKYDAVYPRMMERARELGVEIQAPPPFSSDAKVYFGVRTLGEVPENCQEPWGEVFLLWGWKSRREEATICCGLASDIGAFFDREEIKSVDGFRRFWNQPILRAYRRTANGELVNPICDLCRKIDRFDPEAVYPDQRDFYRYAGLPVPDHFDAPAPKGSIKIAVKPLN